MNFLFRALCCFVVFTLCSCGAPTRQRVATDPIAELLKDAPPVAMQPVKPLQKMGFSIQVGAFTKLDNAVRLKQLLETRGIDAYRDIPGTQ